MGYPRVVARLVSATCPRCGAAVRIAAGQDVVTCDYCRTSSFVQRAGAPVPPPPPAGTEYGTIYIGAESAARVVVPIVAAGALLAISGIVVAVLSSGRSRSTTSIVSPSPQSPSPPVVPAGPQKPAIRAADMRRVELASVLAQANDEARKAEPRAQPVSFVAFKTTNGLVDLTGDNYVSITYEYLYSDPAKPPGADQVNGMVSVLAKASGFQISTHPGWPASHLDKDNRMGGPLEVPRCTSDRMWAAAVGSGVPGNAIADAHLYYNRVFTPKSPLVWSIRVEGHDEHRREIDAHTCAVAKSWAKR